MLSSQGYPYDSARGVVTIKRAHLHSAIVPVRATSAADSDDTAARSEGLR